MTETKMGCWEGRKIKVFPQLRVIDLPSPPGKSMNFYLSGPPNVCLLATSLDRTCLFCWRKRTEWVIIPEKLHWWGQGALQEGVPLWPGLQWLLSRGLQRKEHPLGHDPYNPLLWTTGNHLLPQMAPISWGANTFWSHRCCNTSSKSSHVSTW